MKLYVKSASEADDARKNRTSEDMSAVEVMKSNEKIQDDPLVAIFWYDADNDELFGVKSTIASQIGWYHSNQWNHDVKTEPRLHKQIWQKEHFKGKDRRFNGDHTLVPRGRVFEFKEEGFRVYTGDWIDNYPQVKQYILDEFELPENTKFIKDIHWDIGHGWSDEF